MAILNVAFVLYMNIEHILRKQACYLMRIIHI